MRSHLTTYLTGAAAFLPIYSHAWSPPIIPHHAPFTRTKASTTALFSSSSSNNMGLNEIQTLLREAISTENYKEAARLRDLLAENMGQPSSIEKKRLSWTGLGTAPWLVERLDATKFSLPTTIQINAFESINAMLSPNPESQTLEELMESQPQVQTMGIVISGSTGSGKSLAFLVPMLSTLSESLFQRQRIRVKSEEDVTDAADDLLSRVAVQTSPTVRGQGRSQVGGKGVRMTMGKSTTGDEVDVKSPLALIVVPSRELGVQLAMLLYELVGGSRKRGATELSGVKNMFKYKGPRGVKIGCVLDSITAEDGLKLQTDVAITTPQYLTKLVDDGDINPEKLRVIIFDEADLVLETASENDLRKLFDKPPNQSRLTYLVGASVTDALGDLTVRESLLPKNKTYIATATSFAPLGDDDEEEEGSGAGAVEAIRKASLKELRVTLDPGLIHERCIAPDNTGLLCLCRMLRKELKDYSQSLQTTASNATKIQRPRVVVFFPGETEARASMSKLRDAMWGDHKLCMLLPTSGVAPLEILEQFQSNQTSVMLATPNSIRGLDFADLTHVYTLYLPTRDPREYVHLAGRVGRIGQLGSVTGMGGRVTSILRPEEEGMMEDLANKLGFEFVDVEYAREDLPVGEDGEIDWEHGDVEEMRRYLEDKLTLLGDDEEDMGKKEVMLDLKEGDEDELEEDDDFKK